MTEAEIHQGLIDAFMAAGYKELAARRLVGYLTPSCVTNARPGTVMNPNYPHYGPGQSGADHDFIPVPPELERALAAMPSVRAHRTRGSRQGGTRCPARAGRPTAPA